MFYFMVQAVHSLPSLCSVISTILFPIFLLLLSYPPPWTPPLQTQTMLDSNPLSPQDIALQCSLLPHTSLFPRDSIRESQCLQEEEFTGTSNKLLFNMDRRCLSTISAETQEHTSIKIFLLITDEDTFCILLLQMPQYTLHIIYVQKVDKKSVTQPSK